MTPAERERSEAMARVIGTDEEIIVGLPSCQFCGSRDEVSVGPFMRICAGCLERVDAALRAMGSR